MVCGRITNAGCDAIVMLITGLLVSDATSRRRMRRVLSHTSYADRYAVVRLPYVHCAWNVQVHAHLMRYKYP